MAAALWLSVAAGGKTTATVSCALSPDTWTSVALGARVLAVTEHDGALWAGGFRGLLARSDDAGKNWRVVRRPAGDGLIFAIAFHGSFGLAVGTPGIALETRDDGRTWTSAPNLAPPAGASLLVIGDEDHILAAEESALEIFNGKRWSVEQFLRAKKGQAGPPVCTTQTGRPYVPAREGIYNIAALRDGGSYAALLSDGRVIASSDGGKNWAGVWFHDEQPARLFARSGQFWVKGWDAMCAPRLSASPDGVSWAPVPVAANGGSCSGDCWVGNDLIEVNRAGTTQLLGFPPLDAAPTSRAAEKDTVCVVLGNDLRCALTVPTTAPPAAQGGGPKEVQPPAKLSGSYANWPSKAWDEDIRGQVTVRFLITRQGRPEEISLLAAPDAMLANALLKAVAGWRFRPAKVNGKTSAVEAVYTRDFY